MAPDVFVIGGGPAGLATAIAARRAGFSVTLADGNQPPVDKACGEGLLPDAVEALESLGLHIPAGIGHPLRGIRFCREGLMAQALFPGRPGLGLRRVDLHGLLAREAERVGVELRWGTSVNPHQLPATRWVIGADGATSLVRLRAGLRARNLTTPRFAFRQHYAIPPWTDFVEVHWGDRLQMYVTPVNDCEVGVACITFRRVPGIGAALSEFPALAARLKGVSIVSRLRGAVTATTGLRRVVAGNTALVGDASGTVDAITGEGLGLAFREALALAAALKAGRLSDYQRSHHALAFRTRMMARALLLLGRNPGVLKGTMRLFAAQPETFRKLLALHVGNAG